jgi:hypothetical protein
MNWDEVIFGGCTSNVENYVTVLKDWLSEGGSLVVSGPPCSGKTELFSRLGELIDLHFLTHYAQLNVLKYRLRTEKILVIDNVEFPMALVEQVNRYNTNLIPVAITICANTAYLTNLRKFKLNRLENVKPEQELLKIIQDNREELLEQFEKEIGTKFSRKESLRTS